MQLPSGVAVLAVASSLATLCGPIMLIFSARRSTGSRRRAHALLASGAVVAALSGIVGLLGTVARPAHWAWQQSERLSLSTVVAIGMAVAGLGLCAGLLRLPGAAEDALAAVRLILDGLIIAAAIWYIGWVLVAEPTRLFGDATPKPWPPVLTATICAATAIGLTGIVGARSPAPRRAPVLVGAGTSMAMLCGLALVTGACQGDTTLALIGGVTLPLALLLMACSSRAADASAKVDPDPIRRGTGYAFLAMVPMVIVAVYHRMAGGEFDAYGIGASVVEGLALVARQYLALSDVRGYASRLAEREAHFRELAHTDPLTGLANRRGLLRALHTEGDSDLPRVLLSLDLDGFKNVNDMRGHDVGDEVLMEVGQRLRGSLRTGDVAARLGGDEFAVLMRARPPEAQRMAERLLTELGRPYEHPDGRLFLSVSIGLADSSSAPDTEAMLRNADLALRYAKQRGKDRIERYDVAYDNLLRRRTALEHELRGAIERGELHLAFQPVVAVPSVRPVGAEALLRWHHPKLGSVRPDEFIPLAEECGMITKLGAWVLHQACHQLSLWLADGHDVWVSVNVSPKELHAPEYVVQVSEALRRYRVPPQRLVLEITEHAVATDLDELIRRLRALRLTGVRIALDDFGAGYSSLGQLRRLPIDILKIDHSLVAEPEPARMPERGGRAYAPMVDVVVRLGHQLGLEVIAEGVTNPTELAAVVEAGCRFGQGQLFGWGVPAEHLEAMLDAATSPGARPPGRLPPPAAPPAAPRTAHAPPTVPPPVPHASPPVAPTSPAVTPTPPTAAPTSPASPAASHAAQPLRPGSAGPAETPAGEGPGHSPAVPRIPAQDVRSVDSSREMRQA